MINILLTGIETSLGRMIIENLPSKEFNVTAISPNAENLSKLPQFNSLNNGKLINCKLHDAKELSNLARNINKVNTLIHLDNEPPSDPLDHNVCTNQVINSLNLIGTFGIQLDHSIIRSSTDVYGTPYNSAMSVKDPVLPTTYYGSSLLATEMFWKLYSVNASKAVTILRFAHIDYQDYELSEASTLSDCSKSVISYMQDRKEGVFNIHPKLI